MINELKVQSINTNKQTKLKIFKEKEKNTPKHTPKLHYNKLYLTVTYYLTYNIVSLDTPKSQTSFHTNNVDYYGFIA